MGGAGGRTGAPPKRAAAARGGLERLSPQQVPAAASRRRTEPSRSSGQPSPLATWPRRGRPLAEPFEGACFRRTLSSRGGRPSLPRGRLEGREKRARSPADPSLPRSRGWSLGGKHGKVSLAFSYLGDTAPSSPNCRECQALSALCTCLAVLVVFVLLWLPGPVCLWVLWRVCHGICIGGPSVGLLWGCCEALWFGVRSLQFPQRRAGYKCGVCVCVMLCLFFNGSVYQPYTRRFYKMGKKMQSLCPKGFAIKKPLFSMGLLPKLSPPKTNTSIAY